MKKSIKGNILNVFSDEIYPAEIEFESGIITCVKKIKGDFEGIIIPGLIDAHIHIESSMLSPSFFAKSVVPHGTTSIVADPHEIANVMGLDGINFMLKDAESVPLNIFFSAPSCVPATDFETSGGIIGPEEIDILMKKDEIVALGEMMNFPGVINEDPMVMAKINCAKSYNKPIDGHAPLLSGEEICKYISFGISTDHECSSAEEAMEKKELGMKIMIREGSSAKNLEDLVFVDGDFLVSDDKHPEDLLDGHMNVIIKKAIKLGMNPIQAVKMATINPSEHYSLNKGAISPGRAADFILIDDLENFNVKKVFINGELVAQNQNALFDAQHLSIENTIGIVRVKPSYFNINATGNCAIVRVIDVSDGQLITSESEELMEIIDNDIISNRNKDVLKISVINRYENDISLMNESSISCGFVRGFGIQEGAFASSVAHDSHNIIVIGTDNEYMAQAVNLLIENEGGLVAVTKTTKKSLKLPIAGLMVDENVEIVSNQLEELHKMAKKMGCNLESPFMTMSFLALLVIPNLKISDKGLFDVSKFEFVDVIKKIIDD